MLSARYGADMSNPEIPDCLPDEEPLVDLDAFERAGQALTATIPPDGEPAD